MDISFFCVFFKGRDTFPVISMMSIALSDRIVVDFIVRNIGAYGLEAAPEGFWGSEFRLTGS